MILCLCCKKICRLVLLTLSTKSVKNVSVQTVEAAMPLLKNVMRALKSAGKAMPVAAQHGHDGDEIFLADCDTRKREADLATIRALCS